MVNDANRTAQTATNFIITYTGSTMVHAASRTAPTALYALYTYIM